MSLIIAISLVIRIIATFWSILLWRRVRDWRMGFLTFLLLFMVARQGWTLADAVRQEGWAISVASHLHELPGLGTSIVSCLAVVFLGKMIDDRRRTEQAARANEERLSLSEERFRLIAGATNDAVWDWDLTTNHVWWNEGIQTLFGHAAADIVATAAWWKEQIHPDDREEVVRDIHAVIDGDGEHWQSEYRFRRGDGRYVFVLDRGSVIRASGGRAVRMIGAMLDLTDRREAEQSVRRAQEELLCREHHERELVEAELAKVRGELIRQTRLATLGQLAASIAHELRNPLGSIRNAAYFLRGETAEVDSKRVTHLRIIDEEVNSADRIIGDLLEMSRGKEPSREAVPLQTIIHAARERASLPETTACEVSIDPPDLLVHVDFGQLGQVLANLLINARQAMNGNGRISLNARRDACWDEIIVRDTGPGIPPEDQQRVFEPLFSTKAKGTGLGLAICRQIIERHGGTLELIPSDDGVGAVFRIRLPQGHRTEQSS